MADVESVNFRDRSISQLVQELNSLGDQNVAMHQTALIAIQDTEAESIRRFRSKSLQKSRQSTARNPNPITQSEFFLTDTSQKKYYYNQINHELETTTIATILGKFDQGFNTSILMQYSPSRYHEIISKIQPWFENQFQEQSFFAYFLEHRVREAFDLLSGSNPKSMPLVEAIEKEHPFYSVTSKDLFKVTGMEEGRIKILTLMKKNGSNQLRIIFLPSSFMHANVEDPSLKIVRSQLTQILNYIKTNPNKKYENINKLLPKRYPTTTALAQILLYDSANFILNWVADNYQNKSIVAGRFDFYDRLSGVSNLVTKVPVGDKKGSRIIKKGKSVEKEQINKSRSRLSKSPSYGKFGKNHNEIDETKTKNKLYDLGQSNLQSEQEFCRTFERKTHKYSIDEFGSQPLFPENNPTTLNESESIAILKAQHARQISQYHETIQTLNKKILILTNEKDLAQLFTIHQREIMLLELKIEELRSDISKLCSKSGVNKQNQSLREMVKKLNDEVSHHQKKNPANKLSQGKIKMLEKQLSIVRNNCEKSEKARTQLRAQLEAVTKRLKIMDEGEQKVTVKYGDDDLASKDMDTLKEIQELLELRDKDKNSHIVRKVRSILGDLSEVRETVLECNNFLVDLQDHLESRLCEKDPDVVLDCNRFIRSYLMQNLNIF